MGPGDRILMTAYLKEGVLAIGPSRKATKANFPCAKCHLPQLNEATDDVAAEFAAAILKEDKDAIPKAQHQLPNLPPGKGCHPHPLSSRHAVRLKSGNRLVGWRHHRTGLRSRIDRLVLLRVQLAVFPFSAARAAAWAGVSGAPAGASSVADEAGAGVNCISTGGGVAVAGV